MKAEYLSHFGDDLMVVNSARVSHGKWKEEFDAQDAKLILYLARHKHESPFFHPQAQFRITAPIFVARQWFRHEIGFSRNEQSRRYVDDTPEFFYPESWRSRPDKSIKQGSGAKIKGQESANIRGIVESVEEECLDAYEMLLEKNVAPEQARMVLPQSMYTTWIETGSLMAYARLCRLRLDKHTQHETRDLAKQINEKMAELFPVSWSALMEKPE